MKIYIVSDVWNYNGCTDDFGSCHEDYIIKVFNTEEKAIEFIQGYIKKKIDIKLEKLKSDNSERVLDTFLDIVPTMEDIKKSKEVIYNEYWGEEFSLEYEEYEVE